MDMQSMLLIAGISAGAFFGGKLLVKADTRVEDRRRQAARLGAWCQANGLPTLSSLLTEYSIGNYSGSLYALQHMHEIVGDAELSKQAVDLFLKTQLDKRLADTDSRTALVDYIQKKMGVTITVTPVAPKES
jgi:hypothetical protein